MYYKFVTGMKQTKKAFITLGLLKIISVRFNAAKKYTSFVWNKIQNTGTVTVIKMYSEKITRNYYF